MEFEKYIITKTKEFPSSGGVDKFSEKI